MSEPASPKRAASSAPPQPAPPAVVQAPGQLRPGDPGASPPTAADASLSTAPDASGPTARDGYAVFGKVTQGMDVVDKIRKASTTRVGPHSDVPATPIIIKQVSIEK